MTPAQVKTANELLTEYLGLSDQYEAMMKRLDDITALSVNIGSYTVFLTKQEKERLLDRICVHIQTRMVAIRETLAGLGVTIDA